MRNRGQHSLHALNVKQLSIKYIERWCSQYCELTEVVHVNHSLPAQQFRVRRMCMGRQVFSSTTGGVIRDNHC